MADQPELDTVKVEGIRLSAVASGVRYADLLDLVLIEIPKGASVAGAFTQNAFCAAPVQIARQHLLANTPRYFLINTGNANAGTGEAGLVDALRCCQSMANIARVQADQILPFSTGVIGELLPVGNILLGVPDAFSQLEDGNWLDAATGIMTTDTHPKLASKAIEISGREVVIKGMAKGAGMIKPNMATMLAFIFTDLGIDQSDLDGLLHQAVSQSFNRITVDGDTSTNDACMLVATGKRYNYSTLEAAERVTFQKALTDVFRELAMAIIKDAEGGTKFVTVRVENGLDEQECLAVAYTIAESPLVKTAMYAADPNWGRILAAVGRAGVRDFDLSALTIYLGDVCLVAAGELSPDYTEARGQAKMDESEISISVDLGRGSHAETVWTSDLSLDYVRINAEYRT
jgi:glutamate N-acetyltransferase/amino-acid N-acetyltransferase